MRVLQVNTVCGFGSTGKIVSGLSRALKIQGDECRIAYGRGTAPAEADAIRVGSGRGVVLHVLKTRLFDGHGFGSMRATKALIRRIENYDPDVIHLHNLHGYYLNLGILFDYLKKADKPVIWTLHDCWGFTGHCCYFDRAGCRRWETSCFHCPQKKEYPKSFGPDFSRQNYQIKKQLFSGVPNMTIVTPSQWLSGLVKKSFLKDYPIVTIPNGTNLNIFKPASGDFREKLGLRKKFIILGVSNIWDGRKGLTNFIELSHRLGEDEQIILVGVTANQSRRMPSNVLCIPRTDSPRELTEIYSASDVLINPSLEEAQGLVNIEALACGTPVVTFRTGGSFECVDPSVGAVAEKGSVDALCEAIDKIKRGKKSFFSGACRAKAIACYNEDDCFQDYINLYRGLPGRDKEWECSIS